VINHLNPSPAVGSIFFEGPLGNLQVDFPGNISPNITYSYVVSITGFESSSSTSTASVALIAIIMMLFFF